VTTGVRSSMNWSNYWIDDWLAYLQHRSTKLEMEQMIICLLANQEQIMTDSKVDWENMPQVTAKWEADRKKRKEDFEKMMAKMKAEWNEQKAGMMACLRKMESRIETSQEQSNTKIETDLEEGHGLGGKPRRNGGHSGVAGDP
jgi:hypothetical protein